MIGHEPELAGEGGVVDEVGGWFGFPAVVVHIAVGFRALEQAGLAGPAVEFEIGLDHEVGPAELVAVGPGFTVEQSLRGGADVAGGVEVEVVAGAAAEGAASANTAASVNPANAPAGVAPAALMICTDSRTEVPAEITFIIKRPEVHTMLVIPERKKYS